MKKSCIALMTIATIFTTSTFANTACPKDLTAKGASFTPPPGWNVTLLRTTPASGKVLFYISTYNYDHKVGSNNNRVSCLYESRNNDTEIEITTNSENITKPANPQWKPLDDTSLYCFPEDQLNAAECFWE